MTAAEPQVRVDNAENINVPGDILAHPAVIWLVALVTVGVLGGFGWVTYAVLSADVATEATTRGIDPATKGAVIQTWNNLAVAAAAVWTSSSVVNRLKGAR
jgi:hypothetical protein